MDHAWTNPVAMAGSLMFPNCSALPTPQEILSEQLMTDICGGLHPVVLGIIVGIAVNLVTNPQGAPETVNWYVEQGEAAVNFVAGGWMSGMADGLSNL